MNSQKRIYDDICYLTQKIGVRLTGTEEERMASEFIKESFEKYADLCTVEEFPIMQRDIKRQELEIMTDGKWVKFPALAYNPSPSTNGEVIEAELVYFDAHTDSKRQDWSYLEGKGVLHNGLMSARDHYKRLMEAKPAFLLMVDTRYTSGECIANGMSVSSIKKYGAVPIVDISFTDAVKICSGKSTRARLLIEGGVRESVSQNVIATLKGTDPDAGVIYFGAHIDSVAESVGADDNASGCAIILELIRKLSQKKHAHTLSFIAFGAEEQLSVGSSAYVRAHRDELEKKGRFMCNFDSCASSVGWYKFIINGDEKLRRLIADTYNKNNVYYIEEITPDPCNDLFSFTVAGVPGITHMRNNCEAGRFYHHQRCNTIDVLSMDVAKELVDISSALVEEIDSGGKIYGVNSGTKEEVAKKWEELYGGWNIE